MATNQSSNSKNSGSDSRKSDNRSSGVQGGTPEQHADAGRKGGEARSHNSEMGEQSERRRSGGNR